LNQSFFSSPAKLRTLGYRKNANCRLNGGFNETNRRHARWEVWYGLWVRPFFDTEERSTCRCTAGLAPRNWGMMIRIHMLEFAMSNCRYQDRKIPRTSTSGRPALRIITRQSLELTFIRSNRYTLLSNLWLFCRSDRDIFS
jgi:hypothetical protein